jgi:NADH:ubiquinone oxidoreductase subunit 4 (subunit M)
MASQATVPEAAERADAPEGAARLRIPAATGVALGLAVAGVLVLGIVPGPVTNMAHAAVAQLVAVGR